MDQMIKFNKVKIVNIVHFVMDYGISHSCNNFFRFHRENRYSLYSSKKFTLGWELYFRTFIIYSFTNYYKLVLNPVQGMATVSSNSIYK